MRPVVRRGGAEPRAGREPGAAALAGGARALLRRRAGVRRRAHAGRDAQRLPAHPGDLKCHASHRESPHGAPLSIPEDMQWHVTLLTW